MIGEEEQDPKDGSREMGRYEREVEASFRDRGANAEAQEPDPSPAARGRKALLGWLLFLVVIVGLILVCWPKLEPLMRQRAQPTAPPAQAQAGSAQPAAAAQNRPKRSTYDYPPCTATRTDRCVQQGSK